MTTATFQIWRGDGSGGQLQDFTTPVSEGMVVLDAVHQIQAEHANDLAVRWNCKAGKCGSCSAEVNGHPRLMCMTRLNELDLTKAVTIEPMRAFPLIKDLVTDVSFNFLGQTNASLGDGLFRSLAPEPSGDPVAADLPRRYRLELNASVVEGRLVTQYSYDASIVSNPRVEEVADRTLAALRELIAHCTSVQGPRYTPSDFSAVPVDQQELDALLSDLDLSGLSEA